MEMNIVEQLLCGNENIDRMRREIKQVICLIFRLAFGTLRWKDRIEIFISGEIRWKFEAYQVGPQKDWHYSFRCSIKGWDDFYYCVFRQGPENPTETHPDINKVQRVHESLDVLVKGLLEKLPELAAKIQPLLHATKKFSPSE